VAKGDTVVAFVITKPIPRKVRRTFEAEFWASGKGKQERKKEARKFYGAKGIFYDARAVANEFGTANRPAKPFLRPALEGNAQQVATWLGEILKQKMEQYRSKMK